MIEEFKGERCPPPEIGAEYEHSVKPGIPKHSIFRKVIDE
jgi:hypothetical protein